MEAVVIVHSAVNYLFFTYQEQAVEMLVQQQYAQPARRVDYKILTEMETVVSSLQKYCMLF